MTRRRDLTKLYIIINLLSMEMPIYGFVSISRPIYSLGPLWTMGLFFKKVHFSPKNLSFVKTVKNRYTYARQLRFWSLSNYPEAKNSQFFTKKLKIRMSRFLLRYFILNRDGLHCDEDVSE